MPYQEHALISKVLGALLYFHPSEYAAHGIDQILTFTLPNQENSPLLVTFSQLIEQFRTTNSASLSETHDEFFSGIADMPVPPWGSVYLDRECVLFGESTSEYKQFLTQHGFEFETQKNDPLDHIGLMMMTLGEILASQEDETPSDELTELLGTHMLPWTQHYCAQIQPLLKDTAYASAMALTQSLLAQLTSSLAIQIKPRQVYFNVNISQ